MQTAIIKLGDILNKEPLGLINVIDEQNRLDKKTLNPIMIHISGSEVTDNSEDIANAVSLMEESIAEVCKNALSLSEVTDTKKNLSSIATFLLESRKEITAPLDKIKGKFTPLEARVKKLIDDLKAKEDQIKEQDYQVAEKAIRAELKALIKELDSDIEIVMDVFTDFITNKRKIKGMIPNEKGKLPAASMRQIKDQFELVANPMIEAKKMEETKDLEQNKLAKDLSSIPTSGTALELESSIVNLQQLKEGVDLYFPNISDDATRQIESNLRIVEANIRAEEANAQKKEQESNDALIMKEFYLLDFDTGSIDVLSENLATARDLRGNLLLGENIKKIDEIGSAAKDRLIKLKAEKLVPKTEEFDDVDLMYPSQEVLDSFEKIPTSNNLTKSSMTKEYLISIDDLEVLAGITVEAENQEEAKKIFVGHFTAHLDMINLKEK